MTKELLIVAGPEGKLTFEVVKYKNGEWTAQCREITGIITGGDNEEHDVYAQIFDAIVAAFGYFTQKNSLIERIEGMKKPLQEKHDTLKAQYDLAYHRWFTAGHRGEALQRELKRFESGVDGNVMASCADKLEALDDVLKIVREEV